MERAADILRYTRGMDERRAECRHCRAPLEISHTGPCPGCGQEWGKNYFVTVTSKVVASGSMEARGIEQGRGRSAYFRRITQGKELFRKTGRVHQLVRDIDRRGNRYYEHIEDAETGEVIRHKDELLSEHVAERDLRRREDYGTAKGPA